MRKRFGWLVAGLSLLASLVFSPVALGDHGDWEGYCEGDQPVFTHPPTGEYEAYCHQGAIIVRRYAKDPENTLNPQTPPPDYYTTVFVYINGQRAFNPYQEVNPYIARSSGRTLVPIRFVTEAIGGHAEWFEDEKKVRVMWKDKWMEMVIDRPAEVDGRQVLLSRNEVTANGSPVVLDQPAMIVDGRTVVPIRAVTEAFGAAVDWDPDLLRVLIQLEGAVCPERFCVSF